MNIKYYLSNASLSLVTASLIIALLGAMFFVVEPSVGRAVTSGPFTIKQTITDEISFLVDAANVTMAGQLAGQTGGTANGSTTAVVRTNNAQGYEMSIAFFNNGTQQAMRGDVSLSDSIRDMTASSTEPAFSFNTATTSAVFGYSVTATETTDLDPSFLHNGSNVCNAGGSHTAQQCWMTPTTTSFMIIDRSTSATDGATTTVYFRVYVPNFPTPALVEDVYTATATLTATNQ